MKHLFRTFLSLLLLIVGTVASWAEFQNFAVKLNNQDGSLLSDEEMATQGNAVNFGVAVDDNGNSTRVAADDASAVATITGKYHSEHGLTNLQVVVPVDGTVKISVGTCTYSGSDVVVKNAAGEVVASKSGPVQACWKNDHTSVTELYYTGPATTLTISGPSYCPYVAVEKSDKVVAKYDVSFATDQEAEGVAPATVTWTEGDVLTLPLNRTLYKAGYTLTGWSDGQQTYAIGAEYTPQADVQLQPVFTQNAKNLSDRTEPVTVKWDFQRQNGAPTLSYEGRPGVYVAQAIVGGETIDVKTDFTTSPGKVANANWPDWCQMNGGTTFTIPSAKGAVVSIESYSATTTTTIDGQTDYEASDRTVTYTVGSNADTIDVVIGDGSYFKYIQVVLPVVAAAGGKTFDNEAAQVAFAMNDMANPSQATKQPEDGFSTAAFDLGKCTITALQNLVDLTGTATGIMGVRIQPDVQPGQVSWVVRPAAGLTFTPTKITGYVNRIGTDGKEIHLNLSAKQGEGEAISIAAISAKRNNTTIKYANEVYHFEVDLTAEQQAALAGEDALTILGSIELANNKQLALANVVIEGKLNGTMADVAKYTVATASNLENAGEVSIYPKSDEYLENDEVTLTATEAFGYDFVSWTNKAGEVVSEEAKFQYTVLADEVLTANFKQVETYELALSVEGGANEYMVTLTPAPNVVNGKKMYEAGTRISAVAAGNPILTFNSWSTGETSAEIAIVMDADKQLVADYAAVDYLAGWDFVLAGNQGRLADFASADNEAAALVMRNANGEQSSWLDKSQANGGYEGRPGAVCWRVGSASGDVGHWYWETYVNASAFTDLKLTTAMVYNYNAYQKQTVEYSLDGETWNALGSIFIEGTKKWTDAEFSFPAECNNQPKVYVRIMSDTTSDVDGSASANDGITLGATYITGTAKLINDGVAPKLVNSVPANGATGASANGKIVLTFDEKIKLTDAAKATLDGKEVALTVSGKTVQAAYKGLEYSTDYVFTLAAGSVADLTDNVSDEALTINFQTKVKPAVDKKLYDFIVGRDGKLEDAFAAANKLGKSNIVRYRVLIPAGDYKLPAGSDDKTVTIELADGSTTQRTYKNPTTVLSASNVSFIGVDYEKVNITNTIPEETVTSKWGTSSIAEGIGNGDVLSNTGSLNYFQGLTIRTAMGDARGRDIAVNDRGDKTIFKDARLWGYQDTYVSNNQNGRFYFEGGVLRGRTDYLCGKGDVYYQEVTLQQVGQGGYLAVPSQPKQYGYVFNGCYIKKETSDVTYYLGRPWGKGTPTALFLNTTMDAAPLGNGWADMSGGWPAQFAEFNSMLASGTSLDLSGRRTSWTDSDGGAHANVPVLTADEAAQLTIANVMGAGDDWDPTALTEQASAPASVVLDKASKTLTWADNQYVLGWVVFKNGEIVANVIEPTYEVDDAEAVYTVRAANEAGGLGEAAEATVATGINGVDAAVANTNAATYNVAGQRVAAKQKGIVIRDGKKIAQ